jgi:hypothetical protein
VKRIRKSSLLSQALKEAVKNENKARVAPLAAAKKVLETAQGQAQQGRRLEEALARSHRPPS